MSGFGHHIPVPDHGDDAQRKHQGRGKSPGVLRVIAVYKYFHDLLLVYLQDFVDFGGEVVHAQTVGFQRGLEQLDGEVEAGLVHPVLFGVLALLLYMHESHGAYQRVPENQCPHAHLGAHERDQFPAAFFYLFPGVYVARRGRAPAAGAAA